MRGAAAFVDHGRRTTHKCYNLYFTPQMLTTRDGLAVKRQSQTLVEIYFALIGWGVPDRILP